MSAHCRKRIRVGFDCVLSPSFGACPRLARDSAVVMTEDVREQLLEASSATKKAFNSYRREADPEDHFNSADGQPSAGDKNQDEGEMSFVIVIMQPILRFLQLLCENHNRDLQVGQAAPSEWITAFLYSIVVTRACFCFFTAGFRHKYHGFITKAKSLNHHCPLYESSGLTSWTASLAHLHL